MIETTERLDEDTTDVHKTVYDGQSGGTSRGGNTEALSEVGSGGNMTHFVQGVSGKGSSTALAYTKGTPGKISAVTVAEINREVTRRVPMAERQKVMQERNELVQRKYKHGGLTKREEGRLTYLRWQLDRFDDAEAGEALDRLEIITESHEKLAKELASFLDQVKGGTGGQGKSKRGKRR